MEHIQQVLQSSAQLFAFLGNVPNAEERDEYIQEIEQKLADRQVAIDELLETGFQYNPQEKLHATLFELDKGIQERLQNILNTIKIDLKDLQNAKKNEKQYSNPYGHVQIMDGMYYDKKK